MPLATTKTRAQLVNAALGKLGVIASGQAAEAEDTDTVNAKVDAMLAQLSAEQICEVGNDDEIPSAWFEPLAALLANASAQDFGIPYNEQAKDTFERQLRSIVAARPTYEVIRSEYY